MPTFRKIVISLDVAILSQQQQQCLKETFVAVFYSWSKYPKTDVLSADMIFVKNFTQPQFWQREFYAKKSVNRDIRQFAPIERKCFKMA